jgi:hypothetical protein
MYTTFPVAGGYKHLHALAGVVAGSLVSLVIAAHSSTDSYGTIVLLGLLLVLVVSASWLGRLPRTAPLLGWVSRAGIAFLLARQP